MKKRSQQKEIHSPTSQPASNIDARPETIATLLGLPLYDWQRKVLRDVSKRNSRTLLRCANGGGKTTHIAAPLVLWHALVYDRSTTVLTSGSWRQVKEQLFPAIRQHSYRFPGWKFNRESFYAPNGSSCHAFSTDHAGKFEGWHATDAEKSPLMIILDEAKTIPDPIFDSVERCQPQRLLIMSSPGGCSGRFYEASTKQLEHYHNHVIPASLSSHISQEWISKQMTLYGEDHPLVRSMIHAEFMLDDPTTRRPISVSHLEELLFSPPSYQSGEKRAFCDFAAGGDENVIALRTGNKVELLACWRQRDTMAAVGRFIHEFKEAQLKPADVWAEEDGLGRVMCDALEEAGWPVNRWRSADPAHQKEHFCSRMAEAWAKAGQEIMRKQFILPNDDTLKDQLIRRKWVFDSKGRLRLEPKSELSYSPDRADAVIGAMLPNPAMNAQSYLSPQGWKGWDDWTVLRQQEVISEWDRDDGRNPGI